MKWSLKELRGDVERLHGEEQEKLLFPCLESVVNRKRYARYHFQEFNKLLSEYLANKTDELSLIQLVMGGDEDERGDFDDCRLRAEANIMGCMQSMHSVADILGHVIYYSLNMNNCPSMKLKARYVSIYNVFNKLKGSAQYDDLYKKIAILINNANYQYLADVVNHSKHRSIVGTSFTVDTQDGADRLHGFRFLAFEYQGRIYPERWVDNFLEDEYKRQDSLVIGIGNEINQLVRSGR